MREIKFKEKHRVRQFYLDQMRDIELVRRRELENDFLIKQSIKRNVE